MIGVACAESEMGVPLHQLSICSDDDLGYMTSQCPCLDVQHGPREDGG